MPDAPRAEQDQSWAASARDYLRAAAGGLLVGLPLLLTQEMWAHGALLAPQKLLVLLALAFMIVVGFNAVAGFRRERSWRELGTDSLQSFGVAVIVAALALLTLGRLQPALGLPAVVGRIALESIPVAFGVALASTVLQEQQDGDRGKAGDAESTDRHVASVGRLLIAAGGALYFALNVAPTEEVRILGAEASGPLLLVVVGVSLVMSFGIVFFAEFRGGRRHLEGGNPLETPIGETVAAYAISLLVAALMLWAFGQVEGAGIGPIAAMTVMLGLVASFGAAAGRLLVGGPAK